MKHTIFALLSLISIITPRAHGEENCEQLQEYNEVIKSLRVDIERLEQERYDILNDGDYPHSETYHNEPSVANKPGSEFLREQENWNDSLEKINEKQNNTLVYGSISAALLPVVGYFSYEAWKPPKGSKKVFLEIFFNDHPVHIVSRVMLGLFLAHLSSKTYYHIDEYLSLETEADQARLKMKTLGRLADIEDSIASKKRMEEDLDIRSELLIEACPYP